MANTTWSTTDKASNITLSGSNLIATWNSGFLGGVRAIDKQVTGKFYWECTYNTANNASDSIGIVSPTASLASSASTGGFVGSVGVIRTGTVYVDGISTGIQLGAWSSGAVICLAVDAAARLIWLRVGAAGLWNNSAPANPAAAVGGVAIPNLGVGIPICPWGCVNSSGDQFTANFGDTAFTGAVPAGFTSGFTAGTVIPNNVLATQVTLEHWATVANAAVVASTNVSVMVLA